jgi:cobalt-zinc-cadmium efflux system outer membrane protein
MISGVMAGHESASGRFREPLAIHSRGNLQMPSSRRLVSDGLVAVLLALTGCQTWTEQSFHLDESLLTRGSVTLTGAQPLSICDTNGLGAIASGTLTTQTSESQRYQFEPAKPTQLTLEPWPTQRNRLLDRIVTTSPGESAMGSTARVPVLSDGQSQADKGDATAEGVEVLPPARTVQAGASQNTREPVLDLDYLIELARQRHPLLAAARLNVEAARGRLIQAGLYPNPVVGFESEDIAEGGQAGKHGAFFEQEIVLGGKLRWAQQVAAAELLAADWQAVAQWYDLLTRIRLAWVELLAAESEYRLHQSYVRLVGEEEGGLVFQARRLAKVEGFRWELLRAEVEHQTARARLEAAERRRQAARRELAALLGVNELPGEAPVERLSLQIPSYRWEETLAAILSRSAELKQAEALVQRAEGEWRLIASQNIPNLRVRVRPSYSFSANTPDVRVEGGIMLPIFNRQQGNLFAAQSQIARQARLVESLRLDLTRRLADALGRYAAARQQAQTYAEHILPRAEESLKVMRTVFQRAKAEELRSAFLGLLEAHRAWLEAQLGYLQARRELWLAVFEIAGLLQQERLESLP